MRRKEGLREGGGERARGGKGGRKRGREREGEGGREGGREGGGKKEEQTKHKCSTECV